MLRPAAATLGQRFGVVWALAAATLTVPIVACANIANLRWSRMTRAMARP